MLKIISLNLEGDKHHDTTIPFLKKEKPDVACIQEIFEDDLKLYEEALGGKRFFVASCHYPDLNGQLRVKGTAIITDLNASFHVNYLIGSAEYIPVFKRPENSYTERNTHNMPLLWADITDKTGEHYRIGNIHFTWTPDGVSTEYQKEDVVRLMALLNKDLKEFILAGDFNAPRGRETADMLAARYKDNIPDKYDSSIDPKLHRVPGLIRMVDYIWSTPEYKVSKVRLEKGVSDHKAVVGFVEKA